jgi:calpain
VVQAKVDTGRKQGQFPLVRIRNPWGNDTEWKGAWSDGSREWNYIPPHEKQRLGLTFKEDGEFFMSQKDFMMVTLIYIWFIGRAIEIIPIFHLNQIQHFDSLEMCNLSPDSLDDEEISAGKIKWHQSVFSGSWITGTYLTTHT